MAARRRERLMLVLELGQAFNAGWSAEAWMDLQKRLIDEIDKS